MNYKYFMKCNSPAISIGFNSEDEFTFQVLAHNFEDLLRPRGMSDYKRLASFTSGLTLEFYIDESLWATITWDEKIQAWLGKRADKLFPEVNSKNIYEVISRLDELDAVDYFRDS